MENSKSSVVWISPEVEGKLVKMELDTGSAVSILPQNQFQKLFPRKKLMKNTTLLKTYTGEKTKPHGIMEVLLKHNGQAENLELFIVDSNGPPLLGRDWLNKIQLDWASIKKISLSKGSEDTTTMKLRELTEKYQDVFNDEIRTLIRLIFVKLTCKWKWKKNRKSC